MRGGARYGRRKQYVLKKPRFKPFLNIRVGIWALEKRCSKCKVWRPLVQDVYDKDPTREYSYRSQCNVCRGIYGMFYNKFTKDYIW